MVFFPGSRFSIQASFALLHSPDKPTLLPISYTLFTYITLCRLVYRCTFRV
nr:MAG TPA: hypothetical protein [Caudoviricetes sp.]